MTIDEVLEEARTGRRPSADAALALADADSADLQPLMALAAELRDAGHGGLVTYSPKVFIPLTQLCRDVCHYCTFAHPPRPGEPVYLDAEAVLAIARAGAEAGCHEALFTLGDKPELRYAAARDALARLGHETTLSYLAEMAGLVLARDRPVAASEPRPDDPAPISICCAGSRPRRASCWRARPSGCAIAAGRISARPTRIRPGGSTPFARPARRRCHSPAAS